MGIDIIWTNEDGNGDIDWQSALLAALADAVVEGPDCEVTFTPQGIVFNAEVPLHALLRDEPHI